MKNQVFYISYAFSDYRAICVVFQRCSFEEAKRFLQKFGRVEDTYTNAYLLYVDEKYDFETIVKNIEKVKV